MDLDNVKPDVVTKEFIAVVLAGFGDGLVPLTSDYGDEPCPKALLPVANKPLIDYVLSWVEQSGIHGTNLSTYIAAIVDEARTFDESEDDNVGTCALLRNFSGRISEDFVIVPCDFIPPPALPLSALLNKFRVETLSEGCLATTCWYAVRPLDKATFIGEWGPPPGTFGIIWDASTGTLLHIDTPDDQDRNPEDIEIRMSLLSMFPRTKLSSTLEDSHVYVCRRSVLELLHEKAHFSSLREEFFPWLCKIQYQSSKRQRYAQSVNLAYKSASQPLSLQHSSLLGYSQGLWNADPAPPSPVDTVLRHAKQPTLKIGIVSHDRSDSAVRVNTLQSFYEVNRRILAGSVYSLPLDAKDRSLIDQRAQISSDSIVGVSTQISERTTIKKSVIGRHCIIGKMVKINGCILLDHCVVEDGAKLDGCILGKNTQVGSKAELTRCITQAGYEVSAGETVKGEKLEVSDWMANPESAGGRGVE